MIITESKALKLVANAELAAKIPSLGVLHQNYVRTKQNLARKTGCGSCNLSEPEFATLKEQALLKIRTLPEEEMTRLKNHLVVKALTFFVLKSGKRERIIR